MSSYVDCVKDVILDIMDGPEQPKIAADALFVAVCQLWDIHGVYWPVCASSSEIGKAGEGEGLLAGLFKGLQGGSSSGGGGWGEIIAKLLERIDELERRPVQTPSRVLTQEEVAVLGGKLAAGVIGQMKGLHKPSQIAVRK